MPERQKLEALLQENLDTVDRIVASLCRRHDLTGDGADDFASWVRLRLVQDDYAILGKFRGESSLATYLTVVISMLLREYRVKEWGRWRPSAAARRLGPTAIRLETLVYRDGCSLAQAEEMLRSAGEALSGRELAELLGRLPPRGQPRPRPADPEVLSRLPSPEGADGRVLAAEADARRREVEAALHEALLRLDTEDRVIVRLRIWESLSVADVARALGLPQKPLYRRLERILAELRRSLDDAGVRREDVLLILSGDRDAGERGAVPLQWDREAINVHRDSS